MILPYGKYKGQELDSTPEAYLKWFEENACQNGQLREAINDELKRRHSEENLGIKSTESPSYKSFEELLFRSLCTWMTQEVNTQHIALLPLNKLEVEKSLAKWLKAEVPKLRKIHREQGK